MPLNKAGASTLNFYSVIHQSMQLKSMILCALSAIVAVTAMDVDVPEGPRTPGHSRPATPNPELSLSDLLIARVGPESDAMRAHALARRRAADRKIDELLIGYAAKGSSSIVGEILAMHPRRPWSAQTKEAAMNMAMDGIQNLEAQLAHADELTRQDKLRLGHSIQAFEETLQVLSRMRQA
jgi:hypothetical protein